MNSEDTNYSFWCQFGIVKKVSSNMCKNYCFSFIITNNQLLDYDSDHC